MNRFRAILVFAAALLAAGGIFAWSGVYNIAATEPHWSLTRSLLSFARERSIAYHSRGIEVPAAAGEDEAEGFEHYHETCSACHGAPGLSSQEFASGLNPSPPYLPAGEVQKELTHPELFWVIKNGIKMTGMPAFGGHHDDRTLWAIAAFVRKIAEVSPEAYTEMVEKRSHGHGGI